MAAMVIPFYFTAIDKFSGPVKKMNSALNGFIGNSQRSLLRFNNAFSKMISPITKVVDMMRGVGIYLGFYAIWRGVSKVIDVISEFQQAQVNISSVTGKSVAENKALSDQARDMALKYGMAATAVSQLQFELIKLGTKDVLGTTEAAITGATGIGMDPQKFAVMLNAAQAAYAGKVGENGKPLIGSIAQTTDQIVKLTDVSAIAGEDVYTMLSNSLTAAAMAKVPFVDLLAMMGEAKDAMLQTASAGTAIKNINVRNAVAGKDLTVQFDKITESVNKLKTAYKLYNTKSLQTALTLAEARAIGIHEKYIKTLESEEILGYARARALKQLDTFQGSSKMAARSFDELILSIDDGTGAFSLFLKSVNLTLAAMFLLGSNSEMARKKISEMNPTIVKWARRLKIAVEILGVLLAIILLTKLALVTWSTAVTLATAASWLLNAAFAALRVIILTLNVAMVANPIGLIIGLLMLLVGVIILAVDAYDEWGAMVLMLLGPLGWFINMIVLVVKNWDMVIAAFKNGGVIEGFKAIGAVILDFILLPLQQVLLFISRVTGADWAYSLSKDIEKLRGDMGLTVGVEKTPAAPVNPEKSKQEAMAYTFRQYASIQMDIRDKGNNVESVKSNSSHVTPFLTNTNSY